MSPRSQSVGEATSALDSASEQVVQQALNNAPISGWGVLARLGRVAPACLHYDGLRGREQHCMRSAAVCLDQVFAPS